MIRALVLLVSALYASGAGAVACSNTVYKGTSYSVCEVAATADMRLFLQKPDGGPYGQFTTLSEALATQGARLAFAMNAGMYHPDRMPVGFYKEGNTILQRLITSAGPGNFGLLPNGVLCLSAKRAAVIESRRFAAKAPECRYATQSGPMLVIDGALHPRFIKNGTSRYLRNGVGVSRDGQRVFFAISNTAVNFYDFARFFRDQLETPNALYFDGNVSRLYAPSLNRNDPGRMMGPIIGVVETAK